VQDIYIDGVRLTRGHRPAWSPNGRHIVFERWPKNKDAEIWRIKVDGTGLKRLTRNRVDDTSPAWGVTNRIAFERKGQIYTMGRNGGRVRQITRAKHPSWNPNWSPDGKWLAFNRGARWRGITFKWPEDGHIYKLRLSDRKLVRLTKGGPWKSDPAWSPNGRWIVYVIGFEDSVLAIVRANGTGRRVLNINVDGINAEEARWRPDWQPLPERAG
jgi:TolB protein